VKPWQVGLIVFVLGATIGLLIDGGIAAAVFGAIGLWG